MHTKNQLPRLSGSALKVSMVVVRDISSSWVKIRLHTENQLPRLSGSALKVSVVWFGGWVGQPITLSPKLQLS